MNREDLIRELNEYTPWNEQEEVDKKEILKWLEDESVYKRDNLTAHITVSAWVINSSGNRVLMAYHNLYNSWAWLGGHADGNEDLVEVAVKEVKEESGLSSVEPVADAVFSLEILPVSGHEKHGKYVPSHLHLNLTYLLEADETEVVRPREGENSAVSWFPLEEAVRESAEPWVSERIYKKLNAKLEQILEQSRRSEEQAASLMQENRETVLMCPVCGQASKFTIWNRINTADHPEMAEPVLSQEAFVFHCPHCGYKNMVNYGFLYHRAEDGRMLQVCQNEEIAARAVETFRMMRARGIGTGAQGENLCRVVNGYNELSEKLYIYNMGLNDRAVELMKIALSNHILESDPRYEIKELRYCCNSKTGDGGFMVIGQDGSRGMLEFPEDLYQIALESVQGVGEDDMIIDNDWAIRNFSEAPDAQELQADMSE